MAVALVGFVAGVYFLVKSDFGKRMLSWFLEERVATTVYVICGVIEVLTDIVAYNVIFNNEPELSSFDAPILAVICAAGLLMVK